MKWSNAMATNIRNTENSFTDVALLDTTLNMVPCGLCRLTLDSKLSICAANDSFYSLFHYTKGQALYAKLQICALFCWKMIFHPCWKRFSRLWLNIMISFKPNSAAPAATDRSNICQHDATYNVLLMRGLSGIFLI